MKQNTEREDRFYTETGEGNVNFFGGEHLHVTSSRRSPIGTLHNLPQSGTTEFIGRLEDIQRMHQYLQSADAPNIVSLFGMGGVGKTELALQYAINHLAADTYPAGICWIQAKQDIGSQILSFAQLDDIHPPEDLSLKDRVRWCWQYWRVGEVLLVLDDIQDYADVKPYLPSSSTRFKILLTTRRRTGSPITSLEVDILTEDNSLALLRTLVTDGRIAEQRDLAKALCKWLGYLPLGIELVGRYLAKKSGTTVEKVLERLDERRLDARALKNTAPEMTASLGVAAAFELSWQTLDESAQFLSAFISLFALSEISWSFLQACLPNEDEEDLEDIRDEQLVGLSLLQRKDQQHYQLHQLIREFFAAKRNLMSQDIEMKQTFCRGVSAFATGVIALPFTNALSAGTVEYISGAIPHIKEASTVLKAYTSINGLLDSTTAIARFYRSQVAYREAEFWYTYCCKIAVEHLGEDHVRVAAAMNNLALLHQSNGRYLEANNLLTRSFHIRQKHLGDYHLDVAQSVHNLAVLHLDKGQVDDAEPLLERALAIKRRNYEDDHPEVAIALLTLARVYKRKQRFSEAEELCFVALNTQQRHVGRKHPTVALILSLLGSIYSLQRRYSDAEKFYKHVLQIDRDYYGQDHLEVAKDLICIAELHAMQERYDDAESLYRRIILIQRGKLGDEHQAVAPSLTALSEICVCQEKYAEAEKLLWQAIHINRLQIDDNLPDILSSARRLAKIYQKDRMLSPLFEDRTLLNELATICRVQNLTQEAAVLQQKSLVIYRGHYGEDHAEVAVDLYSLASTYTLQERFEEAESLYKQAVEIWSKEPGQNSQRIMSVYQALATLYQQQERYDDAAEYFEKVIQMTERL